MDGSVVVGRAGKQASGRHERSVATQGREHASEASERSGRFAAPRSDACREAKRHNRITVRLLLKKGGGWGTVGGDSRHRNKKKP